jgi:SAM-dependent methyltransferase
MIRETIHSKPEKAFSKRGIHSIIANPFSREYYKAREPGSRRRMGKAIEQLRLEKPDRVIDVGCGDGKSLELCSSVVSEVVGVDISSDAMKLCRRFAPSVRASATDLPFRDKAFTKVIMLGVAEHMSMEDCRYCFAEIFRILRDRGMAVVQTPNFMPICRKLLNAWARWRYGSRFVEWKNPRKLFELAAERFAILGSENSYNVSTFFQHDREINECFIWWRHAPLMVLSFIYSLILQKRCLGKEL